MLLLHTDSLRQHCGERRGRRREGSWAWIKGCKRGTETCSLFPPSNTLWILWRSIFGPFEKGCNSKSVWTILKRIKCSINLLLKCIFLLSAWMHDGFRSICSRPEKPSTTVESLKRGQHYHTEIASIRKHCGIDPCIFVRLCCHCSSSGGGQLSFSAAEGGRQRPLSTHSSSLSGFHHSSIHLSVRSSLHPSVHIAFCCTCGSIRHKRLVACRFTCRHLGQAPQQVF